MPLNTRPATVGDGALITAFNRERAGYITHVSPTGARVRVHYLSHATRLDRTGARWESVDLVLLVPGGRTCAHCDNSPTRIDGPDHQGAAGLRLLCDRHSRPTAPRLPARPASIA